MNTCRRILRIEPNTHLIKNLRRIHLPNAHHPIRTTHRHALSTVVPAPRPAQERVLEPGRRPVERAVYPGRGAGEGPHVVDEGLGGERGGEKVVAVRGER